MQRSHLVSKKNEHCRFHLLTFFILSAMRLNAQMTGDMKEKSQFPIHLVNPSHSLHSSVKSTKIKQRRHGMVDDSGCRARRYRFFTNEIFTRTAILEHMNSASGVAALLWL
jgi:hypothetical protein